MSRLKQTPLYNYRRARTLNQEQLAGLVGVSQETISRAERGLSTLSADVQVRIATVLGVPRHELFPDVENEEAAS